MDYYNRPDYNRLDSPLSDLFDDEYQTQGGEDYFVEYQAPSEEEYPPEDYSVPGYPDSPRYLGAPDDHSDHFDLPTVAVRPAPYTNAQLDPDKRCIRLLQFHNWKGSEFEFRFVVCPVDDTPPYLALSYTWGPEYPTKNITVDDTSVAVRENLWEALQMVWRKLRHIWSAAKFHTSTSPFPALCIWADALCIDQGNAAERGQQVAMMDEIFKRATLVIAWLGTDPEDQGLHCKCRGTPPYPASPRRHHFSAYPNWDNRHHRSSILRILSQPYWKRLWVVQEFLLAREVLLFYGDHYFWGQDLFRALSTHDADPIHRNMNASKLIFAKFSGTTDQYRLFSRAEPSLKILKDLIVEWKTQQCHDVRDKVFAFLGLAQHMSTSDDAILVEPDYSKSLEDIYAQFVRSLIKMEEPVRLTPRTEPRRFEEDCEIIGLQILGLNRDDPSVKPVLEELWEFTVWRMRRMDDLFGARRPLLRIGPGAGEPGDENNDQPRTTARTTRQAIRQ